MTREEAKREILFAKREVMADSWIDKAYDMAIEALTQPEIVRCKECKHYKTHINCVGGEYAGCDVWLNLGNEIPCEADDYCSYAERKEG